MKTLQTLVDEAKNFILKTASFHKSPVIAWSGGKDSMVLLHLIRSVGISNMPLFIFREPWQPEKYTFQNEIISKWNLVCHTWHPVSSAFQQNGSEFELQNEYIFGNTMLTCPSGVVAPDFEKMPDRWVCAIDMLKRPKQQSLVVDWDVVFIGHKGCDSDPILGGDAGTRIDVKIGNHATLAFPLKQWSHEDIWRYHEEYGVPYDMDRYEKIGGTYREKPEKSKNVDYVHACTNCIDKRNAPHSRCYCPKFNGVIENISDKVPWYHNQKPLEYMRD
jgi:hypothetical protein